MTQDPLTSSGKLLALAEELSRQVPEFQEPDLLSQGLVYPLFGALALDMQKWLSDGADAPIVRTFELINEWCSMNDDEVDNLIQTGFFEVLADRNDLRPRTVELLGDRGRYLYAEIVEFFWGATAVRALGLEPSGTWGK